MILTGCQTLDSMTDVFAPADPAQQTNDQRGTATPKLSQFIPLDKLDTEPRQLAAKGIKALEENNFEDASQAFNQALKLDISNSYLQFLNGYAYHQMGDLEDASKYDLALEGYKLAVQFDPTNWVARYYMGLLQIEQKNYAGAQKTFADAVLYKSDNPDLLYSLAYASYYARDPVSAAGALKHLRTLTNSDAKSLQASAMVMAALNEPEQSQTYLKQYASLTTNPVQINRLSKRLTDWQRFHKQIGKIQLAQFGDPSASGGFGSSGGFGDPSASGGFGAPSATGAAGAPADPADAQKMVIVDVVIIRTQENTTTSKGVNLLNGLTVQFGGTSGGLIFTETKKEDDGPNTQTITKQLSVPSITYSLNIANANSSRNEILARPTLIALAGQESNFFSGTAVTAAAVGGGTSGATINIEKEIGVKLSVIPSFLKDGRVRLKVAAERTFLSTPDTTSVTFTLRIDTTKTNVNANVVMNYGETLILSGLSEKETERRRDGVPGLQDIPLLQYFTSNATTSDFQKSVLILLTPRPTTYVFQNQKQKLESKEKQTEEEKVLSELQARYTDWFRPYPNWASIFHHMQANSLYREFRTGDVTLEKWTDYQSHDNRLKQILDFLFY